MLDVKKIENAINFISNDKKIPREKLIEIIESAIKTAYKKDYGTKDDQIEVSLDLENGTISMTQEKKVVSEVTNPALEISFDELGENSSDFSEGDIVSLDISDIFDGTNNVSEAFGRIAAQAAGQVIIQKLSETEKERIYDLFEGKQGQAISMKIDMIEGGKVVLEYNGNQVALHKSEQVGRDNYNPGQRIYIHISEVSKEEGTYPKVILSRKRAEFVPALISHFVPEIEDGVVEIRKVVRQPGFKTKVLVASNYEEVDPVGTIVGPKGMRIKAVMEELFGEKIDVIPELENPAEMIAKSLTPASVLKVEVDEDQQIAKVYISKDERAKAVGKGGANINLASKLTGYQISIIEEEKQNSES